MLISSDPALLSLLSQRPYFQAEVLSIPTSHVRGVKFESPLIQRYAEKMLNRRVGHRVTFEFGFESHEGRLGLFFHGDSDFDANLWLLSALLDAWNGREFGGVMEKEKVLSKFVATRVFAPVEQMSIQHGSLLVAVAFLSYYGVSVPRAFLVEELGYDDGSIDTLIRHGLLRRSDAGLKLEDYNLAALLIRSPHNGSETYLDLTKRLGSPRLGSALVRKAFAFGIAEYDVLLLNLLALPKPKIGFSDPMAVLVSELDDDFLQRCLENHLKDDPRPGHVGRALVAAVRAKLRLPHLSAILPFERLKSLLESTDSPMKELAWLVLGAHEMDRAASQNLVRSIKLESLARKAEEERHVGKVASLLWTINRADHEAGAKLSALLENAGLADRLDKETEIARVGWVLEVLAATASGLARRLAEHLDLAVLKNRITSQTSNRNFASLLWGLSLCSIEHASSVAAALSDDTLRSRVANEDDAWVLGLLLRGLGRTDPQRSKGLMDSFEPQFFLRIAESEEDVNKLGMLFSGIRMAHPGYTTPLISKTVGELDFESAHHRHMEHAFSNMNPQAMAAEGQAAQRAEERVKAISAFSSFYPPEKFLAAVHNLALVPFNSKRMGWRRFLPRISPAL